MRFFSALGKVLFGNWHIKLLAAIFAVVICFLIHAVV